MCQKYSFKNFRFLICILNSQHYGLLLYSGNKIFQTSNITRFTEKFYELIIFYSNINKGHPLTLNGITSVGSLNLVKVIFNFEIFEF